MSESGKTIYIECLMGAAGDMLCGALYELIDDKESFKRELAALGIPGVEVMFEPATTCGMVGTRARVLVHGTEEGGHLHGHENDSDHRQSHHHATPGSVGKIIDALAVPSPVKEQARRVYDAIAHAEAKAHGCPVGDVHYHEVGALDAVADVAVACLALHRIAPSRVVVSPVHVGAGFTECEHGIMLVPAPATVRLLEGAPLYGGGVQGELCTPTGAALLVRFANEFGPLPPLRVEKMGVGVGSKQFDRPNCVRVFLGTEDREREPRIVELVCNIDDMTPEELSYACSQILGQGALDAYLVAGTMKKGRPGYVLTVLCPEKDEREVAACVLRETTTNGLRVHLCGKVSLENSWETGGTAWGNVRVKRSSGRDAVHWKPEYDDVAALAAHHRIPIRTAMDEVRAAYGNRAGARP